MAQRFAVVLLIYAHPFPSIFLVVQFEGRTLSHEEKLIPGVAREVPELAKLIPVEERNVLQFKLYYSF